MIRNKNGTSIIAGARSVGQNIISIAECLALVIDGFWMVKSRGFKRIIVGGDPKLVIESICGIYNSPWRLRTILLAGFFEDIFWQMQLRVLVSLLIIFIFRIELFR